MNKAVVVTLRVLLALFFLIAILTQFLVIPLLIHEISLYAPEFMHLAVPYGVPAFLAFLCVEITLVAVWILLSMVQEGAVFSERAFRWVNVIIGATWIATGLAAIPLMIMLFLPTSGSPAAFLFIIVVTLGGAAIALMMTVMRALLRQATDARAELSEVI